MKKPTIESMVAAALTPQIITPHALPMFRDGEEGRSTKRKREKERMDPRKSKRPELPITGPGKGGRVGASATQHVVQNIFRDTTRDLDVRFYLFIYFIFVLFYFIFILFIFVGWAQAKGFRGVVKQVVLAKGMFFGWSVLDVMSCLLPYP